MNIGWASRDITPDRPVILRGQFRIRISNRVNDPLTLTALALEGADGRGGTGQAVIVSCDRVSIPVGVTDACRAAIADRVPDFDPQYLFLSATHTHTAPQIKEGAWPAQSPEVMKPSEYGEMFVQWAADAIVEAWTSRKPGGIGWGYGHAVVGHNRRMMYRDGSAKMYGDTNDPEFDSIEGYEDHGVDCLFTWDEGGTPTGTVVNLACPTQETEGESYVSADFWHEGRLAIRRRLGDDLFVLPQVSAAGDQSPHLLLHKAAEARMLKLKGISSRQEIGNRIADAVTQAAPLAQQDIHTEAVLRHTVKVIDLPRRLVTEVEARQAQDEMARLETQQCANATEESVRLTMMRRNQRVLERFGHQTRQPHFPMELHVLRVGDVAFATNSFELFLDFGLQIKACSKATQTFLVQLTGTAIEEEGGYLPTRKALAAKSYGAEVASNPVGPEGGDVLVQETLAAIDELWTD